MIYVVLVESDWYLAEAGCKDTIKKTMKPGTKANLFAFCRGGNVDWQNRLCSDGGLQRCSSPPGPAAGRSLPAAEARNSYPNMRAFRRLRPDRVANFSFLIAPERAPQPAAAPGRRAAPYGRKPVRSAAGLPRMGSMPQAGPSGPSGPQPGGGGGPLLLIVAGVLRRLRPNS